MLDKTIEAVGSAVAELNVWEIVGRLARSRLVAEQKLCAGIAQDEMNGVAGKLEVHRHCNEAGAHDAEIGSEIFHPIGGKDGNAVAARQSAPQQGAGYPVRHGIEPPIGKLTRRLFSAEIDDGELARVTVATNKVA